MPLRTKILSPRICLAWTVTKPTYSGGLGMLARVEPEIPVQRPCCDAVAYHASYVCQIEKSTNVAQR